MAFGRVYNVEAEQGRLAEGPVVGRAHGGVGARGEGHLHGRGTIVEGLGGSVLGGERHHEPSLTAGLPLVVVVEPQHGAVGGELILASALSVVGLPHDGLCDGIVAHVVGLHLRGALAHGHMEALGQELPYLEQGGQELAQRDGAVGVVARLLSGHRRLMGHLLLVEQTDLVGEVGALGLIVRHAVAAAVLQHAVIALGKGVAPLEGFVHRGLQQGGGVEPVDGERSQDVQVDAVLVVVDGVDDARVMAVDVAEVHHLAHDVDGRHGSVEEEEEYHLGRGVLAVDAYAEMAALIVVVAYQHAVVPPP